jgi:hypothetical protein
LSTIASLVIHDQRLFELRTDGGDGQPLPPRHHDRSTRDRLLWVNSDANIADLPSR